MDEFAGEQSHFNTDCDAILVINTVSYTFLLTAKVESFTKEDNQDIADRIRKANPDIVWVSFGGGKQEKWMMDNIRHIDRGIMIGTGAAFRWFTGDLKAPSQIFQKLCLQWLFRLGSELAHNPQKGMKHLIQRQLRKFPKFLMNFPIELAMARRRFKQRNKNTDR